MEGKQESERPFNIINSTDVRNFIASNPSPEDLDELGKHELKLLATHYQLDLPVGINRHPLLIALREVMFDIPNPYLDEDQQEVEPLRQPTPTPYVRSEIVQPVLSASEYLKLKELELRMAETQAQERREMAEQERIKLEREKLNPGVLTGNDSPQQSSLCKNFSDRIKSFRKVNKKADESYLDFATRLEHSYLMWLRSCDVMTGDDEVDGAKLYQLMLVEQFLFRVPKETEFYLRDREFDLSKIKSAATKADHYWVNRRAAYGAGDSSPAQGQTNRPSNINHPSQSRNNPQYSAKFNCPKNPVHNPNNASSTGSSQPHKKAQPFPAKYSSPYYCNYCRRSGHTEDRCFAKHSKSGVTKPHAFSFTGSEVRLPVSQMTCVVDPQDTRPVVEEVKHTPAADKAKPGSDVALSYTTTPVESCRLFVFYGYVTLGGRKYPVTILRDTGATGSLLINPTGKPLQSSESILIRGVAGFDTFPTVSINLECELLKATADVGIVDSLPVPGIDLLLGNDIAGAKVFPHPIVSSEPLSVPETVALEEQHPEVFNVCAVTRSMAKVMDTVPENEESGMSKERERGSMERDGVVTNEYEEPVAVEEGALAQWKMMLKVNLAFPRAFKVLHNGRRRTVMLWFN
ncbi:hypothetical protein Pmani_001409 [Petrolisthes manimaculis]|uniref:Peptidase A2 domain-containing protein n=1 Tax=Petrolisthes manimaculis TaxID=1843537 RepID=A0AAE1QK27_9EUCA|nr:hypothetical protein Pmani_001409 [Petrolisthes manimaculis]